MNYNIEELLALVRELMDSYTSKESTSITYEAAQQLMNAVLYCIREKEELPEEGRGEAAEIVPTQQDYFQTAREAYDNGYRLVVEKVRKAHEIYNDLIGCFKDYGNRAYYDTVVKGMPEFFKWYDPRLDPMNHLLTLDYPVLEPLQDLEGVDLIYKYLQCIRLEQSFLREIPEAHVREVLTQYHSDYEELLINISGLLLKRIMVNMLIGTRLEKIVYDEADYERLTELINGSDKEELIANMDFQLQRLISNVYSGDRKLYRYLATEIGNIETELRNGANYNCLGNTI